MKIKTFKEKILQADLFAKTFEFRLPDGKAKFPTIKGCCFTFILMFMCLLYGVMQAV